VERRLESRREGQQKQVQPVIEPRRVKIGVGKRCREKEEGEDRRPWRQGPAAAPPGRGGGQQREREEEDLTLGC
jgi:hypothetical protein